MKFLREKLIAGHGLFSSYEGPNGQDSWDVFEGCSGIWTAGCWLARRLYQFKASTTIDLGIFLFVFSARRVTMRNLGLLIKTDWSVMCPFCC